MKCNVGKNDRSIRIGLGIVIMLLGFFFRSWLGLVGLVVFVTGIIRFCLLYVPFGISTCENEEGKK